MARSTRCSDTARRAALLFTGTALLFAVGACEKLIGIEDTAVVGDGVAGKAVSDHAGASGAGTAGEGDAQGGKDESAGSGNGGKGGDSAGKAGDESGGASAGSGGGTPQCDCKAPTPVCEAGKCIARGPTQAMAGSTAGNTAFYIDSTEVTFAQYAAFLTAKGSDTSGQRAECAWNDSYRPATIGDDQRPAVNVDFCDAAAYCDWAGERLCGSLTGGQVAPADVRDPGKSQWYLACAGTEKTKYPYGNDFTDGNCNEYPGSGAMADAGKFNKCEGRYPGVFDLVGNAAEWIDACVADPGGDPSMDTCELMGGTFLRDDFDCATAFPVVRSDAAAVYGFRCCSK